MFKKMFERLMPMYETDFTGGAAGGEDPEVAVPGADEGGKDPKVAETGGGQEKGPEEPEKEQRAAQALEERAAFAAMRRENERLIREKQERDELFSSLFPESQDPFLYAQSQVYGKSPEQLQAERLMEEEQVRKDAELEELRQYRAQSTFKQDLSAIQTTYPDVKAKSIEELGQAFMQIMASGGIDAVTAYEVVRAKEEKAKVTPPPEIGKVNASAKTESEFYTMEEVRAMSQEEVSKNWDKIEKSRARWK